MKETGNTTNENRNYIAGTCKYPKEVYSALTSNKTFSIRGELTEAKIENGQSPYKIYDGVFSRFVYTILKKHNGKTIALNANIPVSEIPGIIENTRAALNANTFLKLPVLNQIFKMLKEINNLGSKIYAGTQHVYSKLTNTPIDVKENNTQNSNIGENAKNVVIQNGNFKGKTPFEILLENPDDKSNLIKQRSWLDSNLSKYPKNQDQITAINEAIYMLDNNLISEDDGVISNKLELGDIIIYEPSPKALIRKKLDDGYCPVYEIGIMWHLSDRYPIEITIKNYEAPVNQNENGTINPVRKDARNIETSNYRMSANQWIECVYLISSHMTRFESLTSYSQFSDANLAFFKNKEAAMMENK